jgi:membrane glycosyltransferase
VAARPLFEVPYKKEGEQKAEQEPKQASLQAKKQNNNNNGVWTYGIPPRLTPANLALLGSAFLFWFCSSVRCMQLFVLLLFCFLFCCCSAFFSVLFCSVVLLFSLKSGESPNKPD